MSDTPRTIGFADFDIWQNLPYTKVLEESIKRDYVARSDFEQLERELADAQADNNIAMRRLLWCYHNLLVLIPPSLDIWLENIDKELEGG
jgi:hypothetical protein